MSTQPSLPLEHDRLRLLIAMVMRLKRVRRPVGCSSSCSWAGCSAVSAVWATGQYDERLAFSTELPEYCYSAIYVYIRTSCVLCRCEGSFIPAPSSGLEWPASQSRVRQRRASEVTAHAPQHCRQGCPWGLRPGCFHAPHLSTSHSGKTSRDCQRLAPAAPLPATPRPDEPRRAGRRGRGRGRVACVGGRSADRTRAAAARGGALLGRGAHGEAAGADARGGAAARAAGWCPIGARMHGCMGAAPITGSPCGGLAAN